VRLKKFSLQKVFELVTTEVRFQQPARPAEERKAYRNQYNQLNGTTVKSENKGNFNFNSTGKRPLGRPRLRRRTILKWILKK
jgi:hypothetical protein